MDGLSEEVSLAIDLETVILEITSSDPSITKLRQFLTSGPMQFDAGKKDARRQQSDDQASMLFGNSSSSGALNARVEKSQTSSVRPHSMRVTGEAQIKQEKSTMHRMVPTGRGASPEHPLRAMAAGKAAPAESAASAASATSAASVTAGVQAGQPQQLSESGISETPHALKKPRHQSPPSEIAAPIIPTSLSKVALALSQSAEGKIELRQGLSASASSCERQAPKFAQPSVSGSDASKPSGTWRLLDQIMGRQQLFSAPVKTSSHEKAAVGLSSRSSPLLDSDASGTSNAGKEKQALPQASSSLRDSLAIIAKAVQPLLSKSVEASSQAAGGQHCLIQYGKPKLAMGQRLTSTSHDQEPTRSLLQKGVAHSGVDMQVDEWEADHAKGLRSTPMRRERISVEAPPWTPKVSTPLHRLTTPHPELTVRRRRISQKSPDPFRSSSTSRRFEIDQFANTPAANRLTAKALDFCSDSVPGTASQQNPSTPLMPRMPQTPNATTPRSPKMSTAGTPSLLLRSRSSKREPLVLLTADVRPFGATGASLLASLGCEAWLEERRSQSQNAMGVQELPAPRTPARAVSRSRSPSTQRRSHVGTCNGRTKEGASCRFSGISRPDGALFHYCRSHSAQWRVFEN